MGLKRLLFPGCHVPTLPGRISETAHYEAHARCTYGRVLLACAFFYATDMQVPHVGAWIYGQLFIDCPLVFIFFILVCNEIYKHVYLSHFFSKSGGSFLYILRKNYVSHGDHCIVLLEFHLVVLLETYFPILRIS